MKLYNKKQRQAHRHNLRRNMTSAEVTLWTLINKRQLDGVRFLRQYSIGNYIVDFYSPSCKLAIELDGQSHFEEAQIEYDQRRTAFMNGQGVRVLRFENFEVFDYTQRTLDTIRKYLHSDENPENSLNHG
jgi:very-short-patch-repair endonuclease